ncbi:MAG TPA: sulfatase [Kiritimatiellia bacterium]|jgi:arylsulfatase A-like enzyme|nr:sulfatase [Kiritimatiellia bacterium]HQQ90856.1 sulfatase [Kiritimatiellia bacterium]
MKNILARQAAAAAGCSRLLAACAGLATCTVVAAAPRPNVLFILADDLGWADTTLYGHTTFYRTPNIERLARRGMVFTQAYSASPLCSPTRSAILTGLSPARTGLTTPNCHMPHVTLTATPGTKAPPDKHTFQPTPVSRLKTEYRTLAESLKEAGYATGHFGKWHLGPEPYSPLQQGFDTDIPHWPGPGPAGSFVAPWKFPDFDPDPGVPDQHIEDRMAREAVAWMERHRDRPFYLNYWMFSVHAPFDAKKALIENYRARVDPQNPQRSPTYAAMVESMDDAVGTLLDALDRLGLAERTLIVFTSDNGGNMYNEVDGTTPTSNAPLRGGKATLFEGGTRVPCVIAWPGVTAAGTRSDAVIQSEDFYPTFLEGLGLPAAPGQRFDGISILPALKGGALRRQAVFHYFPHDPGVPDWLPPAVSVHSGDWKLIRLFHAGAKGAHRHLLFNLKEDLGEKQNLAAREPERVRELDALIETFLRDTKAVVPLPNPAFEPSKYRLEDEGRPKPRPAARAKPAADDAADPRLKGWKARGCAVDVKDGIVTLKGTDSTPFLGVGAGVSGPATVAFRMRGGAGGNGKVEWLQPGTAPKAEHTVPYTLTAGAWQTVTLRLPADGPLGIFRLYLPASRQPVDVDWIELTPDAGTPRRWDF